MWHEGTFSFENKVALVCLVLGDPLKNRGLCRLARMLQYGLDLGVEGIQGWDGKTIITDAFCL